MKINKKFRFENLQKKEMKKLSEIIDFNDTGYERVNEMYIEKDSDKKCLRIKQATTKGYIESPLQVVADLTQPNSNSRRGRVQGGGAYTGTLLTGTNLSVINYPYVRKLNALECWKLMGFSEKAFELAKSTGVSERQLRKQAGNSIVVDVAKAIIKELHGDTKEVIRHFELCAGIGAFSEAYKEEGYNTELVGYSEVDKYASEVFGALHCDGSEEKNYGDMTKITKLPEGIDVLDGGTPCQDYSKEGKGAGGKKGSGTRSSLLHEQSRIAIENKIPVVIWENVKNALSKKHREDVLEYMDDLEKAGYTNRHEIIVATEYGIPQNRQRIFIISINEGWLNE